MFQANVVIFQAVFRYSRLIFVIQGCSPILEASSRLYDEPNCPTMSLGAL